MGGGRETYIGKGDLQLLDGLLKKVSAYCMCAENLHFLLLFFFFSEDFLLGSMIYLLIWKMLS